MLCKRITRLAVLVLIAAVSGCGRRSPEAREGKLAVENLPSGIIYDSEISSAEKRSLDSALAKIESLALDGSRTEWFDEVFGGDDSMAVKAFLGDRVRFYVSASTNWVGRVRINGRPVDAGPPRQVHPDVVALNLGTELWINAVANAPNVLQFIINGKALDIPSSRVGIVQLGPGFVRHHSLELAAVFVHEGRHSDCTGGLRSSDLNRIRSGDVPQSPLCGHTHARCPPGHDYAGLFACDGHAWGAYSIDSVYSAGVVLGCASCNEVEKQVARLQSIDSLSRLLIDVEKMLEGGMGPPDMSSSDRVLAE